ncbi:hypothetical protein GQ457_02G024180 [Hibiscus cannabinus]
MVKKSTGKRGMCVDFTSLNKVCPKDSFPILLIDPLVDTSVGHKSMSFMDAFSCYNKIVMVEKDRDHNLHNRG